MMPRLSTLSKQVLDQTAAPGSGTPKRKYGSGKSCKVFEMERRTGPSFVRE